MTDVSVERPVFTDNQLGGISDAIGVVFGLGIVPSDPAVQAELEGAAAAIRSYLNAKGFTGDAGPGATIADLFDPNHPDSLATFGGQR